MSFGDAAYDLASAYLEDEYPDVTEAERNLVAEAIQRALEDALGDVAQMRAMRA